MEISAPRAPKRWGKSCQIPGQYSHSSSAINRKCRGKKISREKRTSGTGKPIAARISNFWREHVRVFTSRANKPDSYADFRRSNLSCLPMVFFPKRSLRNWGGSNQGGNGFQEIKFKMRSHFCLRVLCVRGIRKWRGFQVWARGQVIPCKVFRNTSPKLSSYRERETAKTGRAQVSLLDW